MRDNKNILRGLGIISILIAAITVFLIIEVPARSDFPFHNGIKASEGDPFVYNIKGEVRILNKDSSHRSGFEKLAAQFQKESGIHITIETPRERSYSNSLKEKLTGSSQDPTSRFWITCFGGRIILTDFCSNFVVTHIF